METVAEMTKPLRSPVLGYNHNVRYRGRLFHVQSEDSGPVNPRLYTHLFYEGTILSSKKHEYDGNEHEDAVKVLMQRLHKSMIKELTHSEHDEKITAFFAARGMLAFSEPAPPRPDPQAAPVTAPAAPPPAATPPPYVVQVSGVIESSPHRQPAAAAAPAARISAPTRPMVVIKPTDLKRPPMVFSQSADGVVVQRNVVVSVGGAGAGAVAKAAAPNEHQPQPPTTRIRPAVPYVVREGSHALASPSRTTAPAAPAHATPAPVAAAANPAPVARGRTPSPADKPFSDLSADKSLDDVILEYLSDDGEPEH